MLTAAPVTRDECNAFIATHHRHHGRVAGYRYAIGARRGVTLVGVAVIGRPTARLVDQLTTAEVTRLCTTGEKNVCSFLYSRASRMCREHGFRYVFTCILESESGASLKAAGWVYERTTRGGSWDRPSRPRKDKAPTCPKQIWAPSWCASTFVASALARSSSVDGGRS